MTDWTDPVSGTTIVYPWQDEAAGGTPLDSVDLDQMEQNEAALLVSGLTSLYQWTLAQFNALNTGVPVNIALPSISDGGVASIQVGTQLTALPGTWSDLPTQFTYRWLRNGTAITGADGSTYTAALADVGQTLQVQIVAVNSGGPSAPADSPATTEVIAAAAAAPVSLTPPTITGTPQVGVQLTASDGTWSGSPTSYGILWKRAGVTIPGATAINYTPVAADIGNALTVTVVAANANGSSPATSQPTSSVLAAAPVNSSLPVISGTVAQGYTLSTTTGGWSGSPTSYGYQWYRNGVAISGATGATYLLGTADAGQTITVKVTAVNSGGSPSVMSAATTAVLAAPTITFDPPNGEMVTAPAAGTGGLAATAAFSVPMNTAAASPYLRDNTLGQNVDTGVNNVTAAWTAPDTEWMIADDGFGFDFIPGHSYSIIVPAGAQTEAGYVLPASVESTFTVAAAAAVTTSTQLVRCLNVHPMFNSYPNGVLDETFVPAIITAGAQAVRADLPWFQMQKSRPASGSTADVLASINANDPGESYSSGAIYLARYDYFMKQMARNGIKVMLMVSYPPAWSQTSGTVEDNAPPTNWQDYINFVVFLAERYSTGGVGVESQYGSALEVMEFWNEPDQGYSWDNALGSDISRAAAYVAGLKLVYPALKAAVPSLQVAAPAVSYSTYVGAANWNNTTYDWTQDFFAAGPQDYYDILDLHCYGDPPDHNGLGTADSPAQVVAQWVAYFAPLIQEYDPTAKLYVTEVGWNTGPDGVTAAAQATDLTGVYAAFAAQTTLNVLRAYWYSLSDQSDSSQSASNQDANDYGLFTDAWAAKPALAAFQALAGGTGHGAAPPAITFTPANAAVVTAPVIGSGGLAAEVAFSVPMDPTSTPPYLRDNTLGQNVGTLGGWDVGTTAILFLDGDGYGFDYVGGHSYTLVVPEGCATAGGYVLPAAREATFTVTVESISELSDAFAGPTLSAQWIVDNGATVEVSNGALTIPSNTSYVGITSVQEYNLTGGAFICKMAGPAGDGRGDGMITLVDALGGALQWEVNALTPAITPSSLTDAAGNAQTSGAAVDTADTWFRIRESGGTIYWDYAPDANGLPGVWVNAMSKTLAATGLAAVTALQVRLRCGTYGTYGADTAVFSGIGGVATSAAGTTLIGHYQSNIGSYNANIVLNATGAQVVRIDYDQFGASTAAAMIAYLQTRSPKIAVDLLLVDYTISPATIKAFIAANPGIVSVEMGNELFYSYKTPTSSLASTAQSYADYVKAMFEELAGTGVKITACIDNGQSGSAVGVQNCYVAVPSFHNYCDGWAMHPYDAVGNGSGDSDPVGRIKEMVAQAVACGAPQDFAIYITEYGISSDNGTKIVATNGGTTSYGWPLTLTYAQAGTDLESAVNEMYAASKADGWPIAMFTTFSDVDEQVHGTNSAQDDHFGASYITEANGTPIPKPGFASAIASLVASGG